MDAIQQSPIAALLFLALVLALVTAEALWLRRARGRTTDWSAVAASFGIAIGKKLTDIVTAGAVAGLFILAWDQRFWSVEMTGPGAWLLLFLLVELVYYWHHRCAHEIRWLWAMVENGVLDRFKAHADVKALAGALEEAVRDGRLPASEAAEQLLSL